MAEYIERGKAREFLYRLAAGLELAAECRIDDIPAADVRPERHGHWVRETGAFDKRDNFYHCSECHRTINIICGDKLSNYPYCHCGAKMDGKDGNNND